MTYGNERVNCCGHYCSCHIRAVYESMMYLNSFLSVSLHRFLSECISPPLSLCGMSSPLSGYERISSPLSFYECISSPLSLFCLLRLVLLLTFLVFTQSSSHRASVTLLGLMNRFDTNAVVLISLLHLDYPVPRHNCKSSSLTLSLFNYTLG